MTPTTTIRILALAIGTGFLASLNLSAQHTTSAAVVEHRDTPAGGSFAGAGSSRALYAPDPEYTGEARKAKVKGTVVVRATLGVDGCLRDLRLVRTLGYRLDESAMQAVRRWRFVPYLKNGVATVAEIHIEVNFDPTFTHSGEIVSGEPCGQK